MILTASIYLKMDKMKLVELEHLMDHFNQEVNNVVRLKKLRGIKTFIPYVDIQNNVPWDSKCEVLNEADKVVRRVKEIKLNDEGELAEKYYSPRNCIWNARNFSLTDTTLYIQSRHHKCIQHRLPYVCDQHQRRLLEKSKHRRLKIIEIEGKIKCYVEVEIEVPRHQGTHSMGVDLGIKNPAVAITDTGKVRFFGNGRERRYMFQSTMAKYYKNNKMTYSLHNRMRNSDHQISKNIIDFALENDVSVIKLESLNNLQKKAGMGYSNTKINRVNWSYYRLQNQILYKANKNGIKVYYVNPYLTSKRCPACGKINNPVDRMYQCGCGLRAHRDLVGARNILTSRGVETSLRC